MHTRHLCCKNLIYLSISLDGLRCDFGTACQSIRTRRRDWTAFWKYDYTRVIHVPLQVRRRRATGIADQEWCKYCETYTDTRENRIGTVLAIREEDGERRTSDVRQCRTATVGRGTVDGGVVYYYYNSTTAAAAATTTTTTYPAE